MIIVKLFADKYNANLFFSLLLVVSNESIAENELSKVQPAAHSDASVRLSEVDAEANSKRKFKI